ncbi:MAG: hypothetical protein HN423_03000 [Alphaproteobacteria bacterium]|nr:hypothetical protein [Alphaproteobacteria bacterium]
MFRNEVVTTLVAGALQIEFIDGTIFQLGEDARMVLDELVYDPVTGDGNLAVSLLEGVFRIVSGAIPAGNFLVTTPVATIGIRGTDFEVAVDDLGITTVSVFEGEVEVDPIEDDPAAVPGGRRAVARAGERVALQRGGEDVVRGEARRSEDRGLRVLDEVERERAQRSPADRENSERRILVRGEAVREDARDRGVRAVVIREDRPDRVNRGDPPDRIGIGRRAELGGADERPDRQVNFGGEDRPDREPNFGGEERPDRGRNFGGEERPVRDVGGEEPPDRVRNFGGEERPEREPNPNAGGRPGGEEAPAVNERPARGNNAGADERPARENNAGAEERPARGNAPGENERPDRENNPADNERPDRENNRPDRGNAPVVDEDAPVDSDVDEENRRNNRENDR